MADSDQAIPTPNGEEEKSLSKRAQRKLRNKQRRDDKKVEKKAAEKELKAAEKQKRKREWDEQLATVTSEEEKLKMMESKREAVRERVRKQGQERRSKIERLKKAMETGQNIVLDLDFDDLMTPTEICSLSQQIMFCYAANGRSTNPAHLWLTGRTGEMESQFQKIPGMENWTIEKKPESYIEVFEDQKENLVYLTADSENVLEELDPKSIYIIGGLVDRNRHKGITMEKANKQGIKSAKLPIGTYLKMSSSQVLTVNQVFEIMLNFIETKDWKTAFFKVIPQRKRGGIEGKSIDEEKDAMLIEDQDLKEEDLARKKICIRDDTNGIKESIVELENIIL